MFGENFQKSKMHTFLIGTPITPALQAGTNALVSTQGSLANRSKEGGLKHPSPLFSFYRSRLLPLLYVFRALQSCSRVWTTIAWFLGLPPPPPPPPPPSEPPFGLLG